MRNDRFHTTTLLILTTLRAFSAESLLQCSDGSDRPDELLAASVVKSSLVSVQKNNETKESETAIAAKKGDSDEVKERTTSLKKAEDDDLRAKLQEEVWRMLMDRAAVAKILRKQGLSIRERSLPLFKGVMNSVANLSQGISKLWLPNVREGATRKKLEREFNITAIYFSKFIDGVSISELARIFEDLFRLLWLSLVVIDNVCDIIGGMVLSLLNVLTAIIELVTITSDGRVRVRRKGLSGLAKSMVSGRRIILYLKTAVSSDSDRLRQSLAGLFGTLIDVTVVMLRVETMSVYGKTMEEHRKFNFHEYRDFVLALLHLASDLRFDRVRFWVKYAVSVERAIEVITATYKRGMREEKEGEK